MNIAVFGLGDVEPVSPTRLAQRGHGIVSADKNPIKLGFINQGETMDIAVGVASLILDTACAPSRSRPLLRTEKGEAGNYSGINW